MLPILLLPERTLTQSDWVKESNRQYDAEVRELLNTKKPRRKSESIINRFKGLKKAQIAEIKYFEKLDRQDNQARLNQMGCLPPVWKDQHRWSNKND